MTLKQTRLLKLIDSGSMRLKHWHLLRQTGSGLLILKHLCLLRQTDLCSGSCLMNLRH
ncbi:hypothetical protein [Streptococcus cristatus]|uniref:hypothetical protein n=1 Tax=Streptococcus cristatus TaxID=45634 RepID=UPI0016398E66|nr:hypothetical protein [Streptococcus cristatus]